MVQRLRYIKFEAAQSLFSENLIKKNAWTRTLRLPSLRQLQYQNSETI